MDRNYGINKPTIYALACLALFAILAYVLPLAGFYSKAKDIYLTENSSELTGFKPSTEVKIVTSKEEILAAGNAPISLLVDASAVEDTGYDLSLSEDIGFVENVPFIRRLYAYLFGVEIELRTRGMLEEEKSPEVIIKNVSSVPICCDLYRITLPDGTIVAGFYDSLFEELPKSGPITFPVGVASVDEKGHISIEGYKGFMENVWFSRVQDHITAYSVRRFILATGILLSIFTAIASVQHEKKMDEKKLSEYISKQEHR